MLSDRRTKFLLRPFVIGRLMILYIALSFFNSKGKNDMNKEAFEGIIIKRTETKSTNCLESSLIKSTHVVRFSFYPQASQSNVGSSDVGIVPNTQEIDENYKAKPKITTMQIPVGFGNDINESKTVEMLKLLSEKIGTLRSFAGADSNEYFNSDWRRRMLKQQEQNKMPKTSNTFGIASQ